MTRLRGAAASPLTTSVVLLTATITTTTKAQAAALHVCPKLIWSDEFDGTSLDETKWTAMIGNGCDMGEGMCGWGNNEWQFYTATQNNIEVSDGTLKIHAKYDPTTNQYTSGRIRSLGKADFDLSAGNNLRLEARIKVPLGSGSFGLWPAFWMMPSEVEITKWPNGGEIDIMEYIGKEPNTTYGVMHYGQAWNDKSQKGGLVKFSEPAGAKFHVFAIEKSYHQLTWLVDNQQYMSFSRNDIEPKFDWPFEGTFHFILNLAVGGNWPEYPDPSTTTFPNTLEVDYVRVYDLSSLEGEDKEDEEEGDSSISGSSPVSKTVSSVTTATTATAPQIVGETLVRRETQNVQYCVEVGDSTVQPHTTNYNSYMYWKVPKDATIVTTYDSASAAKEAAFTPNCIKVNFGTQSGYIQANVYFTCGRHYEVKVPIEVQDYYSTEFAFLTPDFYFDQASYTFSTGTYTLVEKNDNLPVNDKAPAAASAPAADTTITPPYIMYQRNPLEVYDYIILDVPTSGSIIPLPNLYVDAAKKFYMDAWSKTAAPCTRFWIQLEDSKVATPANYPAGRHSRYMALLEKSTTEAEDSSSWQRLEFDYYDQPDTTTIKVDRLVILIDSFVQRSDTYYLRNLVSAKAGNSSSCNSSDDGTSDNNSGGGSTVVACEPLRIKSNKCQVPAKSEAGACTDGINNDGYGWNGDQPMDCDDSDCYGIDPACPASAVDTSTQSEPDDTTTTTTIDADDSGGGTGSTVSPPPPAPSDGTNTNPQLDLELQEEEEEEEEEEQQQQQQLHQPEQEQPAAPQLTITSASCIVHPECFDLGLTQGDCCPGRDGNQMSCCSPDLCTSNPRCVGLEGPTCCPTPEGVFLDCCENRPESCSVHPKCAAAQQQEAPGLVGGGDCCPGGGDGLGRAEFMDCCEPTECSYHPKCQELGLINDCCPTSEGIYLDCCNLDLPAFAGFTSPIVQSSISEAQPPPANYPPLDLPITTSSSSEVVNKSNEGGSGDTTQNLKFRAVSSALDEVVVPSSSSTSFRSGSGMNWIGWLIGPILVLAFYGTPLVNRF